MKYLLSNYIIPILVDNDTEAGALETIEITINKPASMGFQVTTVYKAHPKFLRMDEDECAYIKNTSGYRELKESEKLIESETNQTLISLSIPIKEFPPSSCKLKVDSIHFYPSFPGNPNRWNSDSINNISVIFVRYGEKPTSAVTLPGDFKDYFKKLPDSIIKLQCKKPLKGETGFSWNCKNMTNKETDMNTNDYLYIYSPNEKRNKITLSLNVEYY
jgi:hypothetical protein